MTFSRKGPDARGPNPKTASTKRACRPSSRRPRIARPLERVAGFGLPHEDICQLVINPRTGKAISGETLRSAFRKELDRGRAKGGQVALDRTIAPCLDRPVGSSCSGPTLSRATPARAPQCLRDVLDPAHRYPGQIHLDQRLFDRDSLRAAIGRRRASSRPQTTELLAARHPFSLVLCPLE